MSGQGKSKKGLQVPGGHERVLLHSCCAPCTGAIMEQLSAAGVVYTVFFYNPNIHPEKEYLIRKDENMRYAQALGVAFVDADYDMDAWFARTKGLEFEPERGKRCTRCFDMRMERTALYAHEHGFKVIATSMGVSRWKDMEQVYGCGRRAALRYPDMVFWDYNWRKQGGSQRMLEISKAERFYQQEYCGCVYSLRDSNQWRIEHQREPIHRGERFYGVDAAAGVASSVVDDAAKG